MVKVFYIWERSIQMHKHLMAISVLAASMLAVGTAGAQQLPGYAYDTYGKPAKDTWGECVKSVYRQKDAYPECEAAKKVEKIKDKAVLEGNLHFDFDKSQLKPAGKQILDDYLVTYREQLPQFWQ